MALVLGYYDKGNLGDEQYRTSIQMLLTRSGFHEPCTFANPHLITNVPEGTQIIICGGGNIIDDWFWQRIKPIVSKFRGPVVALSVGISYESTITRDYFGLYDHVVLRHTTFAEQLAEEIGYDRVSTIPDLAFSLPAQPACTFKKKRIGIFWAKGIPEAGLRDVLAPLAATYDVVLYSMNVSPEAHEGDQYVNQKLGFEQAPVMDYRAIMSEIAGLELAICARYHAHVFCILQGVPFVSFAVKSKTDFLMAENGFCDNVARTMQELPDAIRYALENRAALAEQVTHVRYETAEILDSFRLPGWCPTLATVARECETMLLRAPVEEVARYALRHVVGTSENKYFWGLTQNLATGRHDILEMLRWLREDSVTPAPRGLKFLQKTSDFSGIHRSGWEAATGMLRVLERPGGLLCDLSLDATFHWNHDDLLAQGVLPFKQAWTGFIHHTPLATYTDYHSDAIFKRAAFRYSLRHCRGIIVLSRYLARSVRRRLAELACSVPVTVVMHPTETVSAVFDFQKWLAQPTVTQVGAWLRNPYAIYALKLPWGQKQVLEGPKMASYVHPRQWYIANTLECRCQFADVSSHQLSRALTSRTNLHQVMTRFMTEYIKTVKAPSFAEVREGRPCCLATIHWPNNWQQRIMMVEDQLHTNYASVVRLSTLANGDYDRLLQQTVVFLNLVDCSAANTVVECIVRNTPVIVNRHPAVAEYLGALYPGFYSDARNVWRMFTPARILAVHRYMARIDKSRYTFDTFVRSVHAIL